MLNFKLKFWNDQPVLVIVLQITIFALLLLALIICLATLGVFGKQWEDTKDHHDHDGNVDVCFLFLSKNGLGKNSYCDFIVASHSIILIALLPDPSCSVGSHCILEVSLAHKNCYTVY